MLEVNVRLVLEYDGADFHGWQVQPGLRTVQGVVEEALRRLVNEEVRLAGAGRTDAGVHAEGQVASFQTGSRLSPEILRRGLNGLLPPDVTALSAARVEEGFHARFDARSRTYRYTIATRRRSVGRAYAWFVPYPLDVAPMRAAAGFFTGRHDFLSFCNAAQERTGHVCTVAGCEWSASGREMTLEVTADRFLRGMVRTMVGTMVDVGRGKLPVEAVRGILEARDRRVSGPAAPAHGLCLVRVGYEEAFGP